MNSPILRDAKVPSKAGNKVIMQEIGIKIHFKMIEENFGERGNVFCRNTPMSRGTAKKSTFFEAAAYTLRK